MDKNQNDCQEIIAAIAACLNPYLSSLPSRARLHLTNEQLLVFSALYAHKRQSSVLLLNASVRSAGATARHLNYLCQFLGVKNNWHNIDGRLTHQEANGDIVSSLSQTIHHLLQSAPAHHFVIPTSLLDMALPDPDRYQKRALVLHQHETKRHTELLKILASLGYHRSHTSPEPGSFSVQGEQINIRPPSDDSFYTIVFAGQTIEQIIRVSTRRTLVDRLNIPPVVFPDGAVPLRELLPNYELIKPLSHRDTVSPGIIFDAATSDYPFPLKAAMPAPGARSLYILFANHDRLAAYLSDRQIQAAAWCKTQAADIPLALSSSAFNLITESKLFADRPAARPITRRRGLDLIASLTPNKPAVHSDHGVGLFEGLQTRTIQDIPKEYIVLRYAAGDTLSVPVEYAHKVTPYIGDKTPVINRLGGIAWQKTRRAAKADAEAFARDLLAAAAARQASDKHSYIIDPALAESMERTFPFNLTADQEEALADIIDDLRQPRPLDRLVVGDVGFGKTEIALRAARHAIANGKQVALLAPTTLLVQQHSDTARARFPDLTDQIGTLSRFATVAEQAAIRQKIRAGTLRLVIGTHALLSAKTAWHNLGLVIIDEEQRFGVAQKEHFKKIRAGVGVLSLSATPIPRTLSMALSGLKELSVISTPPLDRQEVLTKVTRWQENTFKEALQKELRRGGQVYIVAPKVRQLASLAHTVQMLLPKASLAVAHGQLPAPELARIMRQFDQNRISILISSAIIENGLDLPNANTIIVTHAPSFGLADLYQLRGRIGRRSAQGYAYFFYHQSELTSTQRQRLLALTEAGRLGSGWSLAQRDLEIRGAGNLLGAAQSGTVNQVGVQFYLDLVREAVAQKEGHVRRHEVDIRLPLPALIPQHYVAQDDKRTAYYQQLSRSRTPGELTGAAKAIIDTFGPPPAEVTNLILLLRLQHAAAAAGITRINSRNITPPDEYPYWRIIITTKDVPGTLKKLQPLGTWTVSNNTLTRDLNDITPKFVSQLVKSLNSFT